MTEVTAPRTTETRTTMKVHLNSDSSIEGSDTLAQTVENAIHAALDRYGERITRVEVHLSDEAGNEGNDPGGTRCLLEARPAGMDPVVVTGSADTVERACHDAAQKEGHVMHAPSIGGRRTPSRRGRVSATTLGYACSSPISVRCSTIHVCASS